MTLTADIEIPGTIWIHGDDGLLLEGDPVLLGARRSGFDEVSVYGHFAGHEDVVSLRTDLSGGAVLSMKIAELTSGLSRTEWRGVLEDLLESAS